MDDTLEVGNTNPVDAISTPNKNPKTMKKPALQILKLGAVAIATALPLSAHAATFTWDGDTSVNWGDGGNWVGGTAPLAGAGYPNDVVFASVASPSFQPTNLNVGSSFPRFNKLTFSATPTVGITVAASGKAFYIGNDSATAGIGVDNQNTNATMTIAGNLVLAMNEFGLNVVTGGNLTINGFLSNSGIAPTGSYGIEKTGGGILVLNNSSSSFGGTGKEVKITGGTLSVAANGALGNATNTINLNGGTLLASTGFDTSRAINVSSSSAIEVSSAQQLNQAGTTAFGTNTLTKTGTGTLEFRTATNTSSAGAKLIVQEGTVNLQRSDSIGAGATIEIGNAVAATSAILTYRDTATSLSNNMTVASTGATTKQLAFANASGTATVAGTMLLNGNLDVRANVGGNGTISGAISGAGNLSKSGANLITLSGINTYTGNTTVSAGSLTLADNAQLAFNIGASGVNNQINGSGTLLLSGDFSFDLTSAGTTVGNSWNIVDVASLTETFDSTFNVLSFTRVGGGSGSGVWETNFGGADYEFNTSTGVLSVVPEPTTWALLAGSLTALVIFRRRRRD